MNRLNQAACSAATLLLALAVFCPAAESNVLEDMNWEPAVITNPVPDAPVFWFPVGERLTYSIHWGLFHVATTIASTDWVRWPDDRLLLRIQYRTRSNRIIAKLYPVDDTLTSYIDPVPFLPVRFLKNLNEGSRHERVVTDFNHAAGTARWRKQVRKFKDWTLPIAPDTRDIPTLSYWMRREGFTVGITNRFQVMADDKIYDLALTARDRNENVTLSALGTIPILLIELEAAFDGLFVRNGKLSAYVSKGAPCLLTRMDAQVPVANVRILLASIEGHPSNTNTLASTGTQKY